MATDTTAAAPENVTAGRASRAGFVDELRRMIRESSGMVFMDCQSLDSTETSQLRKAVRPTQVRLKVVKNRLMRIACEREKVPGCEGWLKFNTAVAFMGEDPLVAVKAIAGYAKDHGKLKVKGALIDGRPLEMEEFGRLAALPGRNEMLRMVAGMMKAPFSRAARDFGSVFVKMALLLKEAAKKAKE